MRQAELASVSTPATVSPLPLLKQLLHVALGVEYRDNSERSFVDPVDDLVRKDRPEAKLLAPGEIVEAVALSGRFGGSAEPCYDRPDHIARRSETALLKNEVANPF